MLSLTDKPEETLEYQGQTYRLNLCFDNVLQFYKLMDDQDVSESNKILIAFEVFFDSDAVNYVLNNSDTELLVQGVEKVASYINESSYGASSGSGDVSARSFSYEQDAEAIYSSFMQQYHIDLINEQGSLHWDKFKALLHGLNDKTWFGQIIQIRETDVGQIEDVKQKQEVQQLQDYYALTDEASVRAQEQRNEAALDNMFNRFTRKAGE